jgi:UDP-glucose 4-epimerase
VTGSSDKRRFYVTGASGFLGRRVCRRLAGCGEVRALFRAAADGPWSGADLVDLSRGGPPQGSLDGVDTVVHLAARTHAVKEGAEAEPLYRAVNVDGTRRMLEASARAGVRRFVFVSSVKAMGEGGSVVQDETAVPAPVSWYGITKRAAEDLVLERKYTPEAVVLRPALLYGPGVAGNVARMIDAVRAGRFPAVPEVGNRRSLVHVDDAADAVVLAANEPGAVGRVFIVTDGRPCSTREMYDWICEALGGPAARRSVPPAVFRCLAKVGDAYARIRGRRWVFDSDLYDKLLGSAEYDSSAIEEALGFEPRWTFRAALPHIVDSRGEGSKEEGPE